MINWFQVVLVAFVGGFWGVLAVGLGKKRYRNADDWQVWYATVPFFRVSAGTGFAIVMVLAGLAAMAVGWGLVTLLVLRQEVDFGWFVLLSLAPVWASATLPVNRLRIADDRLEVNGVQFALEDVAIRRDDGFVIITTRGILGEAARIRERSLPPSLFDALGDRIRSAKGSS